MFSKVSEQSKGCLVNVFYGSSKNFREDTFNFFPTLRNELIDSLFGNVIDIFCCGFNYSWWNFSGLINNVSTSVRKIISTKKSFKLSFSLFLLFRFILFFVGAYLFCQLQENLQVWFVLLQYYFQQIYLIFLSICHVHPQIFILIRHHWILM